MSAAEERRISVQLQPRHSDGIFEEYLREQSKNPKLRIDRATPSMPLSRVQHHCETRWEQQLNEMGNPPISFFHQSHLGEMSAEPLADGQVTVGGLLVQAGGPNDSQLNLEYTVDVPDVAMGEAAAADAAAEPAAAPEAQPAAEPGAEAAAAEAAAAIVAAAAPAAEETTEAEEGMILRVMRRGYTLRDRLLRPASVVVAKAPATSED